MNKVREKLDRIDKRLEEIERTYDILLSIAQEFYESGKRQRQPNRYRGYEKRHRANQDGYLGYKGVAGKNGNKVCDEGRISDVSGNLRDYRDGCRRILNKFSHGQIIPMKWLLLSLLMYLILVVLVWVTKDMDIPFKGYKWK